MGVELRKAPEVESHMGGQVVYCVMADGVWVGWVGDGRPWRGWRYGARRWWAAWRQDGDTAARWNTDLVYVTRKAAVAGLLAHIEQAESGRDTD